MRGDAKGLRGGSHASRHQHCRSRRHRRLAAVRVARHHSEALDLCEPMQDFFAQTLAEVLECPIGTAIDEGQHGDSVRSQQYGIDRAGLGCAPLPRAERRRVAAFRKVDDQRVVPALFAVVLRQACAQPTGLHAHQRIGTRVEGVFLLEDLDGDDVLLELAGAIVERLLDDEAEESLETLGLLERVAGEHTLELFSDRRVLRRSGERLANVQHGHAGILSHARSGALSVNIVDVPVPWRRRRRILHWNVDECWFRRGNRVAQCRPELVG